MTRPARRVRMVMAEELSPEEVKERARIEALFHGLIRSRARQGDLKLPRRLPSLAALPLDEEEPRWYPIMGMYGGFNYRLQRRGNELQLITESWSRIAEGSERRHLITVEQVVIVPFPHEVEP